MTSSTIGFKTASADLHRKSPWIFIVSLIVSGTLTFVMLVMPLPERKKMTAPVRPVPVVIHLRNIPPTRHIVRAPAPPRPFITPAIPVETHEIIPDDITIELTSEDTDVTPDLPSVLLVQDTGAAEEENEIFEYFAVEEEPQRINAVKPEYPPMASRANIEGTVFLRLLVNREGAVDSVKVEKGPKVFHASAVKAARSTNFKPARQNDRPVSCWVIISYKFEVGE